VLLVALAGCASAPGGESELALPPYPDRAKLVEFAVSEGGEFRFFIDSASLSPGNDGIVRYALVARSPGGVENVSYEGIRCATAEYRVYAIGRGDGTWGGRPGDWQPITGRVIARWRTALQREYFCPQNEPIRNAQEGVRALEQGGHPFSKGFGAQPYNR
jgi:hypothetical protein